MRALFSTVEHAVLLLAPSAIVVAGLACAPHVVEPPRSVQAPVTHRPTTGAELDAIVARGLDRLDEPESGPVEFAKVLDQVHFVPRRPIDLPEVDVGGNLLVAGRAIFLLTAFVQDGIESVEISTITKDQPSPERITACTQSLNAEKARIHGYVTVVCMEGTRLAEILHP